MLKGALALGLPLKMGQRMSIVEGSGSEIVWKSHRPDGSVWFNGRFDLFGFDPIKTSDPAIAERLQSILEAAVRLNSDFLSKWKKYKVDTYLDFEPEWGLGSSSTLIALLALWADVDAFDLQEVTFGGSGYDIACALAEGPVYYRVDDEAIEVDEADFDPPFTDQLYFVYLGAKMNTREAIDDFEHKKITERDIQEMNQLTRSFCNVNVLSSFNELIIEHEQLVSRLIQQPRIKDSHFSDFEGEIKSLGAWGGDFILVSSDLPEEKVRQYFAEKELEVCFDYQSFIQNAHSISQKV